MDRVLISEGGRRFHLNDDCLAVEQALQIWDSDEFTAPSHAWQTVTIADAMARGKEACAVCFPGLRAAWYRGNSENDYGHEPFEYDGAPICARCFIQHHGWREAIAWPCTSAIVLGLAPRTEAA